MTGEYYAVGDFWLDQLKVSKYRTADPLKAAWFVVPFNLERSSAIGDCKGTTHEFRVNAMLDALEASPHFKKSAGANHALVANKWMPVTGGSKLFGVGACFRYPDTP